MRMRFFGIALGLLFFVPAVVSADGHRAGVFAGGSYMDASRLWGNHTTGEYTLFDIKTWRKNIVIIGDFAVHGGSHDGDEAGPKTGLGGAGFRWAHSDTAKWVVGGHVLGGGISGPGGNGTMAWGGVFEILPERNTEGWHPGFRFQYDFLDREGENFHRYSAGVVFRLKKTSK